MKNTHIFWRAGEQVYALTLMNVLGVCSTKDHYQNEQLINKSSLIGLDLDVSELKVTTSFMVNENPGRAKSFNFFIIAKKFDIYHALAVDEFVSEESDSILGKNLSKAIVLDSIYNQQVEFKNEISQVGENNLSPTSHVLFLEKNSQKFALRLDEVECLKNMYDLKNIKIINEDICGYIEYRGCPVPVFNFEQDKKNEGQVVLLRVNQNLVGLAFNKIHHLGEIKQQNMDELEVIFENEKWSFIDIEFSFKKYDLELICNSYQKLITVFDNVEIINAATSRDTSETSTVETFLNFSLGYQFTLKLSFVKSVEMLPQSFDIESKYFNYHERKIPFFDVRKIYGIPLHKITSESRVLIIEIEKAHYACLVDSVGDLIELDKSKSIKFAEWALKDMPVNIKKDIEGHVYALSSSNDRAHTLIFINLNHLKDYISESYSQNKIA